MQTIIDFFEGLGSAITAVIDFLISMVQDLVYMVQLLVKVVAKIPVYFSWIPGEVLAIIVVIIGVAVTYKILGREG